MRGHQRDPDPASPGIPLPEGEGTGHALDHEAFLREHRVGRLATVSAAGVPHVIPVCYAYADGRIYIALDEKPKRAPVTQLRRVRNLLANPMVALVVDDYSEDWTRLAYVLVRGRAVLLAAGEEHAAAVALLRQKYPQYRTMAIEQTPVIAITVERVTGWRGGAGRRS